MTPESLYFDRKSLRLFTGKSPDWAELAKDCVAFANAQGGSILIGIEDDSENPPPGQVIPGGLGERIQKRMGELTVNVQVLPQVLTQQEGQVLELRVSRSLQAASNSDGRYYLRVSDSCVPLTGDDVLRLANERSGHPWEFTPSATLLQEASQEEMTDFFKRLRASDRVNASVKEKGDKELLEHYGLLHKKHLTRLGALLVGGAFGRRTLGTAPIVQAIRYDEQSQKVNKWCWDDHCLSPIALNDGMTAKELAKVLVADSPSDVSAWLGRLPKFGLVDKAGKTTALRYFVPPTILRTVKLDKKTSLTRIEPHRLAELIREDLRRYPESSISDIHRRIGSEILLRTVRTALEKMIEKGELKSQGKNRWCKYSLV